VTEGVLLTKDELQEFVEIRLSIDGVLNLLDSACLGTMQGLQREQLVIALSSIRDDTGLQDYGDIMKLCK